MILSIFIHYPLLIFREYRRVQKSIFFVEPVYLYIVTMIYTVYRYLQYFCIL